MKITTKLIIPLLITFAITTASFALLFNFFLKQELVTKLIDNEFTHSTKKLADKTDKIFKQKSDLIIHTAAVIEEQLNKEVDTKEINDFVDSFMDKLEDGSFRTPITDRENRFQSVAFKNNKTSKITEKEKKFLYTTKHLAPFASALKSSVYNTYFSTGDMIWNYGTSLNWTYDVKADQDFHDEIWFCSADEKHNPQKKQIWTSSYYDPMNKKWMISALHPIYYKGDFFGVVGQDFLLEDIYLITKQSKININNFFLDEEKHLITNQDYKNKISSKTEKNRLLHIKDIDDKKLATMLNRICIEKATSEIEHLESNYKKSIILFHKLKNIKWTICSVFHEKDITHFMKNAIFKNHLFNVVISLIVIVTLYILLKKIIVNPILTISDSLSKSQTHIETKTNTDEINYLINSYNNLSQRNEESVNEKIIFEKQLQQTQKMDAIGRLVSGFAHDFNNLLAGVMGYADLLSMKLENTEEQKYSKNISDVSIKAKAMIQRLLNFSRKTKSEVKIINLQDILNESIGLFDLGTKKTVKIDLNNNANDFISKGDDIELQNVFLNLLINASDAIEHNGIIQCSTSNTKIENHETLPTGNYIKIEIKDSGTGIPDDIKEQIFEAFFTTKQVGKGTGLGLHSALTTIKEHKGNIFVETKVDKGTTFTIILPVIQDSLLKTSSINKQPIKGSGTILVIDDDQNMLDITKSILTQLGYTVILSNSPEKGIEIYKKEDIDIVIIDMIMPEIDGEETFYMLKEINKDASILLISGFTDNAKTEQMLRDGLQGFLKKPYNIIDISKILYETMKKSKEQKMSSALKSAITLQE